MTATCSVGREQTQELQDQQGERWHRRGTLGKAESGGPRESEAAREGTRSLRAKGDPLGLRPVGCVELECYR